MPDWDFEIFKQREVVSSACVGVRLRVRKEKSNRHPSLHITIAPDVARKLGWQIGDRLAMGGKLVDRRIGLIRSNGSTRQTVKLYSTNRNSKNGAFACVTSVAAFPGDISKVLVDVFSDGITNADYQVTSENELIISIAPNQPKA